MIRAALLLSASALLGLGGCEKAKSGPAPAAAAPPGPAAVTSAALGQSAPDFTLKDEQGKEHRLSSYKGKVVVLEWTSPKCPFVRRHYDSGAMPKLAASLDKKKQKQRRNHVPASIATSNAVITNSSAATIISSKLTESWLSASRGPGIRFRTCPNACR